MFTSYSHSFNLFIHLFINHHHHNVQVCCRKMYQRAPATFFSSKLISEKQTTFFHVITRGTAGRREIFRNLKYDPFLHIQICTAEITYYAKMIIHVCTFTVSFVNIGSFDETFSASPHLNYLKGTLSQKYGTTGLWAWLSDPISESFDKNFLH